MIGNQTTIGSSNGEGTGRTSFLTYSTESRLSRLSTSDGPASTELLYDGLGFLRRSRLTSTNTSDFEQAEPVYSSDGLLLSRRYHKQWTRGGRGDNGQPPTSPVVTYTTDIFYFAGRPVAQLRQYQAGGGAAELLYLTTDHLGTPILATDATGAIAWEGGLSPFGTPYLFTGRPPGEEEGISGGDEDSGGAGLVQAAAGALLPMEAAGIFLRFPGQWEDSSFRSGGLGGGIYYNVHRWYEVGRGRYTAPDPITTHAAEAVGELSFPFSVDPYGYVSNQPLRFIDPMGLASIDVGCAVQWFVKGMVYGSVGGAAAGCAGGGALASPGGPAVIGGCLGGGAIGAAAGARAGALGGAIVGIIKCTCAEDDEEDSYCEELLRVDQGTCGYFASRKDWRRYRACMSQAFVRYSECRRFGAPRSPLFPSPFED